MIKFHISIHFLSTILEILLSVFSFCVTYWLFFSLFFWLNFKEIIKKISVLSFFLVSCLSCQSFVYHVTLQIWVNIIVHEMYIYLIIDEVSDSPLYSFVFGRYTPNIFFVDFYLSPLNFIYSSIWYVCDWLIVSSQPYMMIFWTSVIQFLVILSMSLLSTGYVVP